MTKLNVIEHFVVLMLENRSFDNVLGSLYPQSSEFNGINGTEVNLDLEGKSWPLRETQGESISGLSVPSPDPGELWRDINVQIFGSQHVNEQESFQPKPGAIPTMSGFVEDYTSDSSNPPRKNNDPAQIMSHYKPDRDIPALATLARQFAVCDSWFASAPCQTWPNRFFLHTGTAGGYENNEPKGLFFKMPTIFGQFDQAESNPSWAIYHHDIPQTLTLRELLGKANNFHLFDTFLKHARDGVLPNYTFIEPRYYSDIKLWPPSINLPNDMHPPHVVCFGDQLVASVYNALRSNEDAWKKTLLIIIFDEHGGCYDHVPPPSAVKPGIVNGDNPNPVFEFDRFGVRVPAVLVSPFIRAGTILRPSDTYPEDGATPFDHASVINTLRNRFNLGEPLTKRVKAAPTLERALNLDFPENMGPETITASTCQVGLMYKIKSLFELWNDFQQSQHAMARRLPKDGNGRGQVYIDRHTTQSDASQADGVRSDVGAMWQHLLHFGLKQLGFKQ